VHRGRSHAACQDINGKGLKRAARTRKIVQIGKRKDWSREGKKVKKNQT